MNQSCPECGGDPEAICNFCGNKPKSMLNEALDELIVTLASNHLGIANHNNTTSDCTSAKVGETNSFIAESFTDPYEAQGKIPVEEKYNKDGYLVEVKVNGHVIAIPEQHQPSVVILDENLKNTEWIKEKIYLTPEEAKARFPDIDPYLAQGKDFRVHHPVQPKTQVERWKEEKAKNWEAILEHCKGETINEKHTCNLQGTDNCYDRYKKIQQLKELISQATQPIHPRYPTGEFADDIENAPEYIKKSLFGNNFRKVTLLDKIKKLLWD